MRKMLFCLTAAAAGLVMMDYVTASTGPGVIGATRSDKDGTVLVDRSAKGDRTTAKAAGQAAPEHKISSVEVIGLQDAAIVYRDRQGRVLFRTDPVANGTVVVRGVQLPEVTVRETSRSPAPVVQPQAAPTNTKLPDGCEPSMSPLSVVGSSSLRARCFAAAPAKIQVASLS